MRLSPVPALVLPPDLASVAGAVTAALSSFLPRTAGVDGDGGISPAGSRDAVALGVDAADDDTDASWAAPPTFTFAPARPRSKTPGEVRGTPTGAFAASHAGELRTAPPSPEVKEAGIPSDLAGDASLPNWCGAPAQSSDAPRDLVDCCAARRATIGL